MIIYELSMLNLKLFVNSIFLKEIAMLGLVLAFLILALIAGYLGFAGVAIISLQFTYILFGLFVLGFIISIIHHLICPHHHDHID